ncbi:MAG: hypothetical protein V2B19_32890 [Pseudomonadota bacterium]
MKRNFIKRHCHNYFQAGLKYALVLLVINFLAMLFSFESEAGTWAPVGPEGGDIDIIEISPNYSNDQTVFAEIFGAGVFKSIDGGETWTAINNGIGYSSGLVYTRALAISPDFGEDRTIFISCNGIYKSSDGGETWNAVTADWNPVCLIVSPNYTTDNTVFGGTWNGEVLKSTDGGVSWSFFANGLDGLPVQFLAISPSYASDHTLFAGTSGGGAFKSTDGGVTWGPATPSFSGSNLYINSIAISPNYANDQTLFLGTSGGVFKSANGGVSWTQSNAGLTGTYIYAIQFSTDYLNDQTLYLGAWTGGSYSGGVYKSANGGASWSQVNSGLGRLTVNSIAISPNFAIDGTLFAGTHERGVFKSENKGSFWFSRNNGLHNFLVYSGSLVVSPAYTNDQTLFTGTHGGGVFKSTNGSASWFSAGASLGDNAAVRRLAITSDDLGNSTLFAGTYDGLFKSSDGGATWTYIDTGFWDLDAGIYALAISPNYVIDQTIFAGTAYSGEVYKSNDGGNTWTSVDTGPDASSVEVIAISPIFSSDHSLFAGTLGGGVFKSTDGGNTWSAINEGLAALDIYSLVVSPNFGNDYTLFAGTHYGGVYKSIDGGTSWSAVNTGNGGLWVSALAISPNFATDHTVFAGTQWEGVFKSIDGGESWTAVNAGLNNLHANTLAISPGYPGDGTLYVGTEFSSVWKYRDNEAIALSDNATTLWPMRAGETRKFTRKDNQNHSWNTEATTLDQQVRDSKTYYHVRVWNYDGDGESDEYYFRSTEDAVYAWSSDGEIALIRSGAVGETWTAGGEVTTIMESEAVTTPYGGPYTAIVNRKNHPGSSAYWYEYIVPGIGLVQEIDYNAENAPVIQQLVSISDPTTDASADIVPISMDVSGSFTANEPMTVTVSSSSPVGKTVYYRYFYRADYGSSAYDTAPWVVMREYSTENTCEYTFPAAGSYIVVVRMVADPGNEPADLPIVGGVVTIGETANPRISGLSSGVAGPTQPNVPVTYTIDTDSRGNGAYYKWFYRAGYGTAEYEEMPWIMVKDYSTDTSCDYTFPSEGSYIVVVRAVTDPTHEPEDLPITGAVVHCGGSSF